jgi:hypothetical protein
MVISMTVLPLSFAAASSASLSGPPTGIVTGSARHRPTVGLSPRQSLPSTVAQTVRKSIRLVEKARQGARKLGRAAAPAEGQLLNTKGRSVNLEQLLRSLRLRWAHIYPFPDQW